MNNCCLGCSVKTDCEAASRLPGRGGIQWSISNVCHDRWGVNWGKCATFGIHVPARLPFLAQPREASIHVISTHLHWKHWMSSPTLGKPRNVLLHAWTGDSSHGYRGRQSWTQLLSALGCHLSLPSASLHAIRLLQDLLRVPQDTGQRTCLALATTALNTQAKTL